MKGYSFRNIWVLKWLDATGLRTIPLVLMLVVIGAVLGGAFGFAVIGGVPEDFQPQEAFSRFMVLSIPLFAVFINIAFTFVVARNTESVLIKLIQEDSNLEDLKQAISPSSWLLTMSFALATPIYLAVMYSSGESYGNTLLEHFARAIDDGIVVTVYIFGILPLWLIVSVAPLIAILLAQLAVLCQIAERIFVDLINLQKYAAVSTPFVQVVVASTVMLSATLLFGGYAVGDDKLTALIGSIVVILMGVWLLLYLWPVWIMRRRIHAVKQLQLEAISAAIQGDKAAQANIIGVAPGEILSNGDLFARQMFIESRWEWPVAEHLQKLIVFALLPPLTWVLAAVVENFMF